MINYLILYKKLGKEVSQVRINFLKVIKTNIYA